MLEELKNLWATIGIADAVLLLWLVLAVIHGFSAGLIRMIGNVVGLFAGIIVAGWYYQGLAAWGVGYLPSFLQGLGGIIEVIAFAVILIVFAKVTGLIFEALNSLFNIIDVIPGLGFINRVGGAVVSFLEAVITIAVLIYAFSKYPMLASFEYSLADSKVANYITTNINPYIEPLLPDLLKSLPAALDQTNPFASE